MRLLKRSFIIQNIRFGNLVVIIFLSLIQFPITYAQELQVNWTEIGPTQVPVPMTSATGLGRINVIKYHPNYDGFTNKIIFAGAHQGGLWKSYDNGNGWINMNTDHLPVIAFGDLAFHPQNPDIMFLVTGDPSRGLNFNNPYGSSHWAQSHCPGTAQNSYLPVVKPDTTKIIFAHRQLAGNIVDTLFIAKDTDTTRYKILYHGAFFNQEITTAGFLKVSNANDSMWYYRPEDSTKMLIFNLNLQKGETFYFNWLKKLKIVDSVFYKNGRKIIQFDIKTDWNEKVKFIEGVGPNISPIRNWDGFLSPIVICKYDIDVLGFENDNPAFENCGLNTTSKNLFGKNQIKVYPNPVNDFLFIQFSYPSPEARVSLFTITGEKLLDKVIKNKAQISINTANFESSVYILKLTDLTSVHQCIIIKK